MRCFTLSLNCFIEALNTLALAPLYMQETKPVYGTGAVDIKWGFRPTAMLDHQIIPSWADGVIIRCICMVTKDDVRDV